MTGARSGELDLTNGMRRANVQIMNKYSYRVKRDPAFDMYKQNGMSVTFDPELFNGLLTIEAPDEETADKIRMTYTDITMWEKVEE